MAKRPTPPTTNTPVIALPVISVYRQHDRVEQVMAIMRDHDYGSFMRSAGLVDETMTDDRIYGVSSTRIGAILSAPMKFQPTGTSPQAVEIAEEIEGKGDHRGLWEEMFSTPAAAEILKWGVHLGIGFGRIMWDTTSGLWRPRLVPWHPQNLRWDWMARRFVVQTDRGAWCCPVLMSSRAVMGNGSSIAHTAWSTGGDRR